MRWVSFSRRVSTQKLEETSPSSPEIPNNQYGYYNQNQQPLSSSRTDSWPNPPASVEPPRIAQYSFIGSPAPAVPFYQHSNPTQDQPRDGHNKTAQSPPQLPVINENATVQHETHITTSNQPSPVPEEDVPTPEGKDFPYFSGEVVLMTDSGEIIDAQGAKSPNQQKPSFMSQEESKPKPPEGVIQQVEATRLGTVATQATEASEQADITPPVRRRTPPLAIHIDFSDASEKTEALQSTANNSTWATSPSTANLAPPVDQNPMTTPGLAPPVNQLPMNTPNNTPESPEISSTSAYDTQRPTCSLNLVCYRGGAKGCVLRQVQTVLSSRFPNEESFRLALAKNPQLIASDDRFFKELRRLYTAEMSNFWRRYLSLKTLTGLRVLAYSPVTRPNLVPLDDFVLQEMYYAYEHPASVSSSTDWIEWVFRLRRRNKRHALEFVEGWNSTRVVVAAMLPWLVSCVVGVAWSAMGADPQTAFTVASFILTSGTVILGLLAVISGIESQGAKHSPIG